MFAVIKTGGKQYKVAANDVLKVEKLAAAEGDIVTFDQVLMVGNGDDVTVGAPLVAGASVAAEFLGDRKNKTVLIVKKHRRQHFDRRNGHRQVLSSVRITEILLDGARPSGKTARPEKPAEGASEAADRKPARSRAKPKAEAAAAGATGAEGAPGYVDDVKLIGGIGPAIEKKLAAAGITSLAQIAAWTKEEADKADADLELRGRVERDEWIEQARDLVAGKPPRAKVDQAAKADKE